MKLIKQITDLNKATHKDNDLGFVPTMGSLHKGHEYLIKISKKLCKKTLVSIFVNPNQFNNKEDYKNYPKNLNKDLRILKKLKVDLVFLPSVNQIYKDKRLRKINLKESQKILCAKYRKGHFEGVLDVLNRFVKLISPKIMFMGEKDYQQFFLVKEFISKKYNTIVYKCKTIRNMNNVALSSRNKLLSKADLTNVSLITHEFIRLKKLINKENRSINITSDKTVELIQKIKKKLIKKFKIKIEYIECRNLLTLSKNIKNKPFKLFVAYYFNNIRLIDNF